MKGDDLENVCYLREDVPKNGMGSWVSHGWGPGMPWLLFFFLHHFLGGFLFLQLLLGIFLMCFYNFWIVERPIFLGTFRKAFFFEKKMGIAPSYL